MKKVNQTIVTFKKMQRPSYRKFYTRNFGHKS